MAFKMWLIHIMIKKINKKEKLVILNVCIHVCVFCVYVCVILSFCVTIVFSNM